MLQKIKDELVPVPSIISFSLWKNVIEAYLTYITTTFANIEGIEDILKSQIKDQFNILYETFQEVELAIYYSLFDLYSRFPKLLDFGNIGSHISKRCNKSIRELNDDIFTKQTFGGQGDVDVGESCWMLKLQMQNSLSEENWIYLPFNSIYNDLKARYPRELSELEGDLFKLHKFAYFIEYVVNFPQICAFYSFYQKNSQKNSNINELIKFSIKDFMNFNQNYFIEVYKIAISIMLNYNLAGKDEEK